MSTALQRIAQAVPGRVRLMSLARTLEGRDVWLVSLGLLQVPGKSDGSPADGTPAQALKKTTPPAILIVANLEADHVIGSQVALALIDRIAWDPAWEELLTKCTLHVVPRLNPDGAENVLHDPRREIRTNLRPLDRDRDGRSGEDGPDDLDGDHAIVQMRVKDAKATLVPDSSDPRRLHKADLAKGERPVYSEYAEGIDNDGDGQINEDPPGGVNLNRNASHRWTEFDPEAGFNPASEPETRALIQFAFDHPEIVAIWSFSLNDNLESPPKKPESTIVEADLPVFGELSRLFARARAGATAQDPKANPPDPPGRGDATAGAKPKDQDKTPSPNNTPTAAKDVPPPITAPATAGATTDGSVCDWAYHHYGAIGMASRLWQGPELPRTGGAGTVMAKTDGSKTPALPPIPDDGDARWLYWNDHVMDGRAFVTFKPFDHPSLGKVELGGWKPGVRVNPPIEQAEPIARTQQAFLAELVLRLPRLAIKDVKVSAKGGGLFQVSARVVNEGELPTALAQGVRSHKAAPVRIRLDMGAALLLAGPAQAQIDTLSGSGGHQEFRWLIMAPDAGQAGAKAHAITLSVSSPKAGKAVKTISLEPHP